MPFMYSFIPGNSCVQEEKVSWVILRGGVPGLLHSAIVNKHLYSDQLQDTCTTVTLAKKQQPAAAVYS